MEEDSVAEQLSNYKKGQNKQGKSCSCDSQRNQV